MTVRLDPSNHPWMTDPGVGAVMDMLEAAQPDRDPSEAGRFVGGCVRNAVLGRPVADVDVATALEPTDVMASAEAAGVKVAPTGLDHGTVTAVSHDTVVEITTLRRDVTTDGRNATVAFTDDWAEDARRRDFRINALYADRTGAIFDPVGGLADTDPVRFVFIGDADERIAEDYLRILRFFRFNAWYGEGEPDADGLAACRRGVRGLRRLSAERVWKELKALFAAPDPERATLAMADVGVLDAAMPEAVSLDLFRALMALEREEAWAPDPLLRVAALAPRLPDVAARIARRLKLSNADADRLRAFTRSDLNPRLLLDLDEDERARQVYGRDRQALIDRTRLAFAIDAAQNAADPVRFRDVLRFLADWTAPTFPVTGADVMAAGVPKGPPVGAALKALETLWVRSGFQRTKEDLIAALPMIRI